VGGRKSKSGCAASTRRRIIGRRSLRSNSPSTISSGECGRLTCAASRDSRSKRSQRGRKHVRGSDRANTLFVWLCRLEAVADDDARELRSIVDRDKLTSSAPYGGGEPIETALLLAASQRFDEGIVRRVRVIRPSTGRNADLSALRRYARQREPEACAYA